MQHGLVPFYQQLDQVHHIDYLLETAGLFKPAHLELVDQIIPEYTITVELQQPAENAIKDHYFEDLLVKSQPNEYLVLPITEDLLGQAILENNIIQYLEG